MVYFVQDDLGGPIKIGYSREPWRRLRQLQTASGGKLICLGLLPGTNPAREKELHEMFREDRIRGEWFRPSEKLLDFIRSQCDFEDTLDLMVF